MDKKKRTNSSEIKIKEITLQEQIITDVLYLIKHQVSLYSIQLYIDMGFALISYPETSYEVNRRDEIRNNVLKMLENKKCEKEMRDFLSEQIKTIPDTKPDSKDKKFERSLNKTRLEKFVIKILKEENKYKQRKK